MTQEGFQQAIAFLKGIRPNQTVTREMTAAWALKLGRYDDDIIMAALFALAERPTDPKAEGGLPVIQVGDVLYACKTLANRRAIEQATAERLRRREIEATTEQPTRKAWGDLPAAQRAGWLAKARTRLEGMDLPVRGTAPMMHALARLLAKGGDPDARAHREVTPFACRGCGRALILTDPPTNSADCERCGGPGFTLPDDWRASVKVPW